MKFLEHPIGLIALCFLILTGCSATIKAPIEKTDLSTCGLLGPDCWKRLVPGSQDQVSFHYFNPAAQWTQYKKVKLNSVSFWTSDNTKIAVEDQSKLVDFFHQQVQKKLDEKTSVVTETGPDVLDIDIALTDAEAVTPVLRSISMLVPQAHMLSNLVYLATDKFPFVGGAQAEIKITDSMSGAVLYEGVDKRIGGGNIKNGFQWKWGDAEHAITEWSEIIATRLAAKMEGKAIPDSE